MHLHSLVKKGSSFALALATITSPLATTQAFADTLASVEAEPVELAQASPTPTPSPSPATPTPSPSRTPATPSPSPATPTPSPSRTPATPSPSPATPTPSPSPAPATPPTSEGGFTPAPPPAAGSRDVAPAPATTTVPLNERTDLIGACRQTNRTLEVFRDTALSSVNRVGTFAANTQVRLTGVVGTGRAQVYWPTTWPPTGTISVVGWVNSANLTTCGLATTPKACYQIVLNGLSVRTGPSTTAGYRGSLAAGAIALATSNPPREETSADGRIWAEINYESTPGWISRTGVGGVGTNAARLADTQCP